MATSGLAWATDCRMDDGESSCRDARDSGVPRVLRPALWLVDFFDGVRSESGVPCVTAAVISCSG